MDIFVKALKAEFGDKPFKAEDVLMCVGYREMPAPLQYAIDRRTSPVRSVGHFLASHDQVEVVAVISKVKLYRLKPLPVL